ncbi:Cytochrome c-555 [Aliarcobacter thereius]|uniref:Cytochrome c-555 n=2 Tax=Aliarcobacter thereius TaxID=544718 RepID=A0A1C0BA63_9BACT|nr:c-type cytochrome [Aliarcobacter thereius]OCL88373.1 Cytochrome c-555 [Aliarcobacter thereius]OCL91863.1 Cytochrome c-555 [Aliarcobacter thereius]OCL95039.1 Cytochrome c-555 [Aliarcobacter thereius LMG 24486]OCM00487.1 Cytochrome c-555 [Aliarcobacter thereius]QBF16969.1 hypothetical protein ATH_1957 [Aliarcobacter thereius LMG 24486]
MKKSLLTVSLLSILTTSLLAGDKKERSGAKVYAESCAVCHSTKFLKEAPKFGSKDDWEEFIEEGQQFPVAHGWVGTRKMPRHGGDPKITLNEFINATAYLGNSAGADWKEAKDLDKETYKEILKEIQIRLQRNELYDKIGKKY